jgi:signal transduction histidine kinase
VIHLLRVVRAGVVAALAVALAGWGVGRVRFGATDAEAAARVERELRGRVDGMSETLRAIASRVAAERQVIDNAPRDPVSLRRLFDVVAQALPVDSGGAVGATVYDRGGSPLAWAGRVSDLPKERTLGPATVLLIPSALGPRLVRIDPISAAEPAGVEPAAVPAAVVVEQSIAADAVPAPAADAFFVTTAIAPVRLMQSGVADRPAATRPTLRNQSAYTFPIPTVGGGVLVEAEVAAADLAARRERWSRLTAAAVLGVLALTLVSCVGPLLDRRKQARTPRTYIAATALLIGLLFTVRVLLWIAGVWITGSRSLTAPAELLLTAGFAAAVAAIVVYDVSRRRAAPRHPPLLGPETPALGVIAALYAAVGAADGALLSIYARGLQRIVSRTTIDLLHFSLHPFSAPRLALAFGLILMHAAVIWLAAAIALYPSRLCRTRRDAASRALKIGAWLAGATAAISAASAAAGPLPAAPVAVALIVAGASAITVAEVGGRLRRASQSARIFMVFLALLAPAVALYPSVVTFATDAKERLVTTVLAPEVASQRQDLERRLRRSLVEIDSMRALADFVTGFDTATPTTDRAYLVWSRTELGTSRLTSSVELFTADGRLVSPFALHLPEYSTSPYIATSCTWDELVDEVSPFGSSERQVLRTSRGICEGTRIVGGIVVRAMLDPEALTISSPRGPLLEPPRTSWAAQSEGVFGRDVEFAMYGWSRAPLYAAGASVWRMPDDAFARMAESRESFWTSVDRDGDAFRVFFQSDRVGVYALGYPITTAAGHFINLAELVLLTAVLYGGLLTAATLFGSMTIGAPATGRALFREIRSSFYLKLFFAFVASVVIPVAILAAATRTYFKNQLLAGAEDAGARTVTTAQRLVEDYATLQQRGTGALGAIDDNVMVLVRRAIDEDVNLFDRQRLQATSARDLFASQMFTNRTPSDVYRAIVLDRLPAFVGEETIGSATYSVAAAPVHAGSREAIVTVPLTNRQQDIEQQIDELDRRVVSGAVFFCLLGAALGYWMAERIADPVNRLTRATRRIARGDLDARIAATSSDELRRLVEDFNQMAADLQRQRAELERTQRLEAWADMARQVAHDIKNPLTPIQLSAEHAQRVNADRGRPLSPVLDECVHAILTQVKLLRQISAEFSSFASSPTPRPEPTAVGDIIDEVVEPYRTGLAGRIAIMVHTAPGLPNAVIDRTLFARALTNVVENALHAMPGKGSLTITTRAEDEGVVVEITDTGVGMDPESIAKIFEPYFSTKATGTGLGLTIAKRNVELNRGTIDVRSQRNVGTTVTIRLPAGIG